MTNIHFISLSFLLSPFCQIWLSRSSCHARPALFASGVSIFLSTNAPAQHTLWCVRQLIPYGVAVPYNKTLLRICTYEQKNSRYGKKYFHYDSMLSCLTSHLLSSPFHTMTKYIVLPTVVADGSVNPIALYCVPHERLLAVPLSFTLTLISCIAVGVPIGFIHASVAACAVILMASSLSAFGVTVEAEASDCTRGTILLFEKVAVAVVMSSVAPSGSPQAPSLRKKSVVLLVTGAGTKPFAEVVKVLSMAVACVAERSA
jgi:hypothetical protein